MPNKFEGDWSYKFVTIDNTGEPTLEDKGHFHLPEVDAQGNLNNAKDDDNTPLTGEIRQIGPLEIIHLNRASGPERHLRGILVFEGTVLGVSTMIVVGERRRQPFPHIRMGSGEAADPSALAQTDGTWVATKP